MVYIKKFKVVKLNFFRLRKNDKIYNTSMYSSTQLEKKGQECIWLVRSIGQNGQLVCSVGQMVKYMWLQWSPTLQVDSLPAEPQGKPRILEWVAYPFSRGSSHWGIEPGSPALQGDSLLTELSGKPSRLRKKNKIYNTSVYSSIQLEK